MTAAAPSRRFARGEEPVRAAGQPRAAACRSRSSREALATGDMGFLHSFTTGSAVDGPGVRVVAWTTGCMWRCQYCHNPDTWTLTNGMPVSVDAGRRGTAQVPPRPQGHVGRLHHQRRRAADAAPLRGASCCAAAQERWAFTRPSRPTAISATGCPTPSWSTIDLVMLGIKAWDPERHLASHREGHRPDARLRPPPGGAQAADLDPLRARAGTDRRPGDRRPDRGVRRRAWATSSGSKCCRSTRWADSSGKSSDSITHSTARRLPLTSWSRRRAASSGRKGSRHSEDGVAWMTARLDAAPCTSGTRSVADGFNARACV